MKKNILLLFTAFILIFAARGETALAQLQSRQASSSADRTRQPKPARKYGKSRQPKWMAGTYKQLVLGKSTVKDVERIFGKPRDIIHPEDEFDNPIGSRLDYIYDDEPQIIIDKKTGKVIEIWGGDFSTFDEAREKYGNDFYEVDFTPKGCVFKPYRPSLKTADRVNIAYPQYGFYFYVKGGNDVYAIYYVDKCR